jgi:hypothetical protein
MPPVSVEKEGPFEPRKQILMGAPAYRIKVRLANEEVEAQLAALEAEMRAQMRSDTSQFETVHIEEAQGMAAD